MKRWIVQCLWISIVKSSQVITGHASAFSKSLLLLPPVYASAGDFKGMTGM